MYRSAPVGTITARPKKDGTKSYFAQIVLKHGGAIVHRENKTFRTRKEAAGWVAIRELELGQKGVSMNGKDARLGDVIDRYTEESIRKIGRTKAQVLNTIKTLPIAQKRCSHITSGDIVSMAKEMISGRGVQPQTVGNYLSHLGSVFAVARPAWGIPLDQQVMRDAFVVAKRLGVTSKSRQRDRRPTIGELDKLLEHFDSIRSNRIDSNPMHDIVLFALFSTRRQEEITRIAWADLDVEHSRVLVRDMKHPGDKVGNDQWVDVPPEAMAVIRRQQQVRDGRIFPASTDAISAAFTRACHLLGIDDLHFHDLRHEGISRLFEMGWNIPQVATVSGHRSWQSLKRYTHMRQRGDKYAGWKRRPE